MPRCFDQCIDSAVRWTEASDLLPWGTGRYRAEQEGLSRGSEDRELLSRTSCSQLRTIRTCSRGVSAQTRSGWTLGDAVPPDAPGLMSSNTHILLVLMQFILCIDKYSLCFKHH